MTCRKLGTGTIFTWDEDQHFVNIQCYIQYLLPGKVKGDIDQRGRKPSTWHHAAQTRCEALTWSYPKHHHHWPGIHQAPWVAVLAEFRLFIPPQSTVEQTWGTPQVKRGSNCRGLLQ